MHAGVYSHGHALTRTACGLHYTGWTEPRSVGESSKRRFCSWFFNSFFFFLRQSFLESVWPQTHHVAKAKLEPLMLLSLLSSFGDSGGRPPRPSLPTWMYTHLLGRLTALRTALGYTTCSHSPLRPTHEWPNRLTFPDLIPSHLAHIFQKPSTVISVFWAFLNLEYTFLWEILSPHHQKPPSWES